MKKILLVLLVIMFTAACKKDRVEASTPKAFQESINDMTSSLNTLQQDKFNEALYILKTYSVVGETDMEKMINLGKLLNGKKVRDIMILADKTAQEQGIKWSSVGPPSLGTMNIFGDSTPKEIDLNNIKASALNLVVTPVERDSLQRVNALLVTPHLVDSGNLPIAFSNALLEASLEVFSNNSRIYTSKKIIQDHHFKGFLLKVSHLSADKVIGEEIDITVRIKTTGKTYQMTKSGIRINPDVLKQPKLKIDDLAQTDSLDLAHSNERTGIPVIQPKSLVSGFLGNLASQNFKEAYKKSNNPNWDSYEVFSNPTSGFGTVKGISVKKLSTISATADKSSVNALYEVTDKDGKMIELDVTFGLKNTNGEWKIVSYKIN